MITIKLWLQGSWLQLNYDYILKCNDYIIDYNYKLRFPQVWNLVGVLGPGKKIGPNGSYKQLLKWGSMGEMSQQGQGVNKAHPCTGVRGAPHAAGLNELGCSLALIPTTEDMILGMQVPG